MSEQQNEPFEGWAIVEVMGHRRLAGYVREEVRFGVAMLRIDIPAGGTVNEPVTQYYPGTALFCVTPTTQEVVAREVGRIVQDKPYQLSYPGWRESRGFDD